MNQQIEILLSLLGFSVLIETIRRGIERVARQQREMNRMMIRLAKQMGYPVEDDDLLGEVRVLIQQGDKIKAIKLVRHRKGDGLKEAKEYVDAIQKSIK